MSLDTRDPSRGGMRVAALARATSEWKGRDTSAVHRRGHRSRWTCARALSPFTVLLAALLFLGLANAWAADPPDTDTAEVSACSVCCMYAAGNLVPGPAEGAEGEVPCTTPSGPLEVSDGFGAMALQFEGASYVTATFDRATLHGSATVGAWNFARPSLSFACLPSRNFVRFG